MTLRVCQIRETKLESYRVIVVSRSKDLGGSWRPPHVTDTAAGVQGAPGSCSGHTALLVEKPSPEPACSNSWQAVVSVWPHSSLSGNRTHGQLRRVLCVTQHCVTSEASAHAAGFACHACSQREVVRPLFSLTDIFLSRAGVSLLSICSHQGY